MFYLYTILFSHCSKIYTNLELDNFVQYFATFIYIIIFSVDVMRFDWNIVRNNVVMLTHLKVLAGG